ncbi:uncharacterized protein [Asterias amurensis]
MGLTSSSSSLQREAVFEPEHRARLLGQSSLNISGISAVRCSARCLRHHRCVSFNYDRINRVCQLNNASREETTGLFHHQDGYSYYESKNISTSTINTGSQFDAITEPNESTTIAYTTLQESTMATTTGQESTMATTTGQASTMGTTTGQASTMATTTGQASTMATTTNPCKNKLGMEDGSISDGSITASSSWNAEGVYIGVSTPADGRLNKVPTHVDIIGAWHPRVANLDQWIQVDLGSPTYVTCVLMQGRQDHWNQWVTKYKVQFRETLTSSLLAVNDDFGVSQVFDGNVNPNGIVESCFDAPILMTVVRLIPVEWNEFIAIRFELLGCAV